MGTAWKSEGSYPWENARWVSGVEVIKVNIALRIYAAKWHVYAGLAMLNPSAQRQIQQNARSVTELYKLMVGGHADKLAERVWAARKAVFGLDWGQDGNATKAKGRKPILLTKDVLNQFSRHSRPSRRGPTQLAP